MPTVTSNLVELLTYLAPGFVVLYGFRRQSDSVQDLFNAVTASNGYAALLAFLVIAIAFGVIIAAMSMLLIPFLARRFTRKNSTFPLHIQNLNLGQIYTHNAETLRALQEHSRAYQATANMATALLVCLVSLLYNVRYGNESIDHWQFKIRFFVVFLLLTILASIRYFRFLYLLADSLSNTPPKPSSEKGP